MLIMCGRLKQTRRSIASSGQLHKPPFLQFFDPKKETIIQSDASMDGHGCTLIQDEKPVCYASRALTETESPYSNIERELLSAMWSLEHLNHYIEGNHVVLQTDHKPLVTMDETNSHSITKNTTFTPTNESLQR